ncbi:hypothetical protein TrispH2_005347 [Trichoplax sp. H2]|nr:hypothetical protein TrispH2_005347 [Trichoplax sp. H2]|eukprot:RDD43033.1 hypothetical protein TrispH2_005347 [Trichoplax sp. H2]
MISGLSSDQLATNTNIKISQILLQDHFKYPREQLGTFSLLSDPIGKPNIS